MMEYRMFHSDEQLATFPQPYADLIRSLDIEKTEAFMKYAKAVSALEEVQQQLRRIETSNVLSTVRICLDRIEKGLGY